MVGGLSYMNGLILELLEGKKNVISDDSSPSVQYRNLMTRVIRERLCKKNVLRKSKPWDISEYTRSKPDNNEETTNTFPR